MSSPMAKQALSNSLSTVLPSSSSSAALNPYINTISFGAGAASAMYGQASGGKKAKVDEVCPRHPGEFEGFLWC